MLKKIGILGLGLVMLLTGCSSLKKTIDHINASAAAYTDLQNSIKDTLASKFHLSVRSVSCSPHVSEVLPGESAHLTCLVRLAGGSSYTTPATIVDPSHDPDIARYNYRFEDPPGTDITTAALPKPTVTLMATSPRSLFASGNLAAVKKRLVARFGAKDVLIQLAIYPGELEGVVGSNGTAWLVTATYTGKLTVGRPSSFDGSRSGIGFGQLVPSVIGQLAGQISARYKVPPANLGRFVLTNSLPHGDSGWNIYTQSGTAHFQALVLGQQLVKISR
jgi:hypothetical protein